MNLPSTDGYPASPASLDRPLPSMARPHGVSEVTPAKKITFFKSGDPQFGGVKMAINRRSFKSFSALMDDLSNRVPLPFGVRTITTPRGTHSINRLDQLQDGGSYICSDKKYVQPIARRKNGPHRPTRPVSARRQVQQEEPEEEYSATHFQQVPKLRKKILLVKNGDPIIRQSILLNRQNARNFKTFLEDASDLFQFTVRRVYTVDGRRVENIQAVLQSPNVLICAGKEPFKPILSETVRKSITEKLPGLPSHQNHNSEIKDNKKNASFGLKAKKSVIHPRSASSNKTRLSLSSEKSYPNGLNMSPANSGFGSCPHSKPEDAGHSVVNDDIEKRVHVNKDGSLSVEMKVRFRLLNEETLQWSTQIKKSSTSGKAKCDQLCLYEENGKKGNPEMFSETEESFYPYDGDSRSSKLNDAELEDMYCAHCGLQCQQYDIWKNPMHANPLEDYTKQATWQTRSSASSTSSHHKLACDQKTSMDSIHTFSSEEYVENVVHQSACYSKTRENGETMVRYSSVSRSTSRSGQSTAASNKDTTSDTNRKPGDSQYGSCSSRRSRMSLQSQQSKQSEGLTHLNCQRGSFESYNEASLTPCSETNNCSQGENMVSQCSHPSRKSERRLHKRGSTNTKSFGSNISYNEDEEKGENNGKTMEHIVSEDHCSSKCTEQPDITNQFNETDDQETGEKSAQDVPLKSPNSECDNSSVRSSSHSKSSSKNCRRNKSCGQNNNQLLCSSPCMSSISKQNSEKMSHHQESLEVADENVDDHKSTKSCRKSYVEREHSFQSDQSSQAMSPVELALTQGQKEHDVPNEDESCNKSSKSLCTEKPEEGTTEAAGNDGQVILPISRSSSKCQSLSSNYINSSCVENEKTHSVSSRASRVSDKKSKLGRSPESIDSMDSAKDNSQSSLDGKNINNHSEDAERSNKILASVAHCIHSPSPPKEKAVNKHLRSVQYRNSRTNKGSGEMTDSSRSSTPQSKRGVAAKNSTENNKMLKNSVTSLSSTEDIHSTEKCKNSTSSSKRKHNRKSLDGENNTSNELTPSALPNVTPEEVVHEWLRKIPSPTMVVEYEVEECQKKAIAETEAQNMDIDKEESGALNGDSTTEIQNNDPTNKENAQNECSNNSDTGGANLCMKDENDLVLANNHKTVAEDSLCDKKSLPNNVQTSVQIMKALLNASQDSKFDRSNSLPEVSQTMGRKLSNSAKVLISCLASLQLLEDGTGGDYRKNINDINTPKYNQLLTILQALWAEEQTIKNTTNSKTAKQYSREDELTPVSSSGVDINSGFDGSGDGSVTGAGDIMIIAEKLDANKFAAVVEEVKSTDTIIQDCKEEQDTVNGQLSKPGGTNAGFEEARSFVMDENMNEKKISNSLERGIEDTTNECKDGNFMNIVNNVETETEKCGIIEDDAMNIINNGENETKSNECNSQESSDINSPRVSQSTVKSTSDSNEKTNATTDEKTFDPDPAWVLNLLKKIEKNFMTHYVDAMNEFKVKWNLESNENLDEMISELKNAVGQRIQKSISYELKRIKSQAGVRVPKPPVGPRRKSSLQAEERRRRLQTMHQRSIRRYANSDYKDGGTNDLSCETDEEDLTFSASLGDDSNGQANEEFCPCEKCIKQKRALRLAKPRSAVSEAPIVKAFDLQQILKMKREIQEPKDDRAVIQSEKECDKDVASITGNNCPSDGHEDEPSEDNCLSPTPAEEITKSDISDPDNNDNESDGLGLENEVGQTNIGCESTCHDELEGENKSTGDLDENTENNLELDDHFEGAQDKELSIGCKSEDNTAASEKEQQNQLEEEPNFQIEDSKELTSENGEPKEIPEPDDRLPVAEDNAGIEDMCCENRDCSEETETMKLIINLGKESEDEDIEANETCASYFHKSLARGSLITQNGSAENIEGGCKEANNALEEMSPNGHSNGSGSKQSQMYPDSSSEEEAEDSPRASPACKNECTGLVVVNNKGRADDHDSQPMKDDVIDQDDLDF